MKRQHEPCTTCGGEPHPSGVPCVCGGVGTIYAEVQGLREAALEAHVILGWYPQIRPKDGRPTYTDLADALRDFLGSDGMGMLTRSEVRSRARGLLSRLPKDAA